MARHQHLSYKKFREYQALIEEGDRETCWRALGVLVEHLEDHLVMIEGNKPEAALGEPRKLTVFHARDPEKTELYVLVTAFGEVVLGRPDDLSERQVQRLNDFDPFWHEVLSISVTGSQRMVGDKLDLWIVVRQVPRKVEENPVVVAYHGLVSYSPGHGPELEPARDDWHQGETDQWVFASADRLPPWLCQWNISYSHETDPFSGVDKNIGAKIEDHEQAINHRSELAAMSREHICLSVGDEIYPLNLGSRSGPPRHFSV